MKIKRNFIKTGMLVLIFALLSNEMISCKDNTGSFQPESKNLDATIIDDGSTTNYADKTTAPASAVIADDLYENFAADGTVEISFNGKSWTSKVNGINASEVSIKAVENSQTDETSSGVEIQYKGSAKLKYVLSGRWIRPGSPFQRRRYKNLYRCSCRHHKYSHRHPPFESERHNV